MNEQTRLARPAHAVPFTADDFLRMMELGAFEDMRAELVRGEIEKMTPAGWTHGELNAAVAALIYPIARATGARLGTDVVLRVDQTTVRAPDVSVIRPGISPGKVLRGSDVLLAIEIAETTQARDLGEKREEYAKLGIPAYWVVDCEKQLVHSFMREGDAYGAAAVVPFGEPLPLPGLGASITLDPISD